MSNKFRQVDRETLFLLPPSIDDWLPEGHPARFIVEIVAQLDLTTIKAAYAGRGSRAHHPEVLPALLFYGYSTGVFSSRKLERATYDSVAFRYIAANDHPDHDTIATFRKRFLPELTPPTQGCRCHHRDEVPIDNKRRPRDLCQAKTNRRTGLRYHQGHYGLPTVSAPRGGVRPRRVESGLHGLESEAVTCSGGIKPPKPSFFRVRTPQPLPVGAKKRDISAAFNINGSKLSGMNRR